MLTSDIEYFTLELEQFLNRVSFDAIDEGGINALAITMDNSLARCRDVRVRLPLQKAQQQVRDAHHALIEANDPAVGDMLSVAAYWLGKAMVERGAAT